MECESTYFPDIEIRQPTFFTIERHNANDLIDTAEEKQELKNEFEEIIYAHPGQTLRWRHNPTWTFPIPNHPNENVVEQAVIQFQNFYNDYYTPRRVLFGLASSISFGLRSLTLRPLYARLNMPFTDQFGVGIQAGYASITLLDPNLVTNATRDQFQFSFNTHPWSGACVYFRMGRSLRAGLESCVDLHFPDQTERIVRNGNVIAERTSDTILVSPSLNATLHFHISDLLEINFWGGIKTLHGLPAVDLVQANFGTQINLSL